MTEARKVWHASQALDAVEQWAQGAILVREIGLVPNRRLDGVLVPLGLDAPGLKNSSQRKGPDGVPVGFFDRHGLAGIEVKITRADFQRGLTEGQFEDYSEHLIGLYVVTTLDVCRTAEIPRRHGHLLTSVLPDRSLSCVCKRKPRFEVRQPTHEQLWRILDRGWKMLEQKRTEIENDHERQKRMIGQLAEDEIMTGVRELVRKIREPVSPEVAALLGEALGYVPVGSDIANRIDAVLGGRR